MNERQKTAQVLADAGHVLRKVASERDFFMQKCAELTEQNTAVLARLEAEKLAAEAHEAGYYSDRSFPDLVDYFEKAAQEGRLPIIKEAMQAQPPSMGGQFAISNDESQSSGVSELERFLVGNVG
jgi:hypothetical protein